MHITTKQVNAALRELRTAHQDGNLDDVYRSVAGRTVGNYSLSGKLLVLTVEYLLLSKPGSKFEMPPATIKRLRKGLSTDADRLSLRFAHTFDARGQTWLATTNGHIMLAVPTDLQPGMAVVLYPNQSRASAFYLGEAVANATHSVAGLPDKDTTLKAPDMACIVNPTFEYPRKPLDRFRKFAASDMNGKDVTGVELVSADGKLAVVVDDRYHKAITSYPELLLATGVSPVQPVLFSGGCDKTFAICMPMAIKAKEDGTR